MKITLLSRGVLYLALAVLALSRFEDRRSGLACCPTCLGRFTAAGWAFAFLCSFRILWVLILSQVL
jgi:hypothetical protein